MHILCHLSSHRAVSPWLHRDTGINVLQAVIVSYLYTNSQTTPFNCKCNLSKFKPCHEECHRLLQTRIKRKIYTNKILSNIWEPFYQPIPSCVISFSTSTSILSAYIVNLFNGWLQPVSWNTEDGKEIT